MAGRIENKAIEKAFDRLSKAKQELQRCRSEGNFTRFASHWSAFLIHSGSVLNALEAGAKATPQGRQWYGGEARKGRADPLVAYMHQARNAEEHNIEETTQYEPPGIAIGTPAESNAGIYIKSFSANAAFHQNPEAEIAGKAWRLSDGKPPTIVRLPGGPALLPVKDKFNTTYWPPKEHQGRKLPTDDPIRVAEAYVVYLEDLIKRAGEL